MSSWRDRLMDVRRMVGGLGLERERAALALVPLGFFLTILGMNVIASGFMPVLVGLALYYATAFLAVAARWFWGRWFANGLGWFGFGMGLFLLVHPDIPPEAKPVAMVITAMHAIVILALMGSKMAALFEMQPAWRERFAMDEYGVRRLGKAVTRGAGALPGLIVMALGGGGSGALQIAGIVAFLVGACGVAGMLRLRTWGALALAAVALLLGAAWLLGWGANAHAAAPGLIAGAVGAVATPGFSLVFVLGALAPLARPAWRFLRE